MACASIADRKLKAANSNPEAPERKVQRGSASSDELMVDSAAPSWGQNFQRAKPQKPALRSIFSV